MQSSLLKKEIYQLLIMEIQYQKKNFEILAEWEWTLTLLVDLFWPPTDCLLSIQNYRLNCEIYGPRFRVSGLIREPWILFIIHQSLRYTFLLIMLQTFTMDSSYNELSSLKNCGIYGLWIRIYCVLKVHSHRKCRAECRSRSRRLFSYDVMSIEKYRRAELQT